MIGEGNQIEDMDDIKLWYEEMPEVFEREKKILESKGFILNEQSNDTIEFIGKSSVLKEYPLKINYPNGYPSFPPTVISDVSDELVLIRHQTKLNKVLCCFGFSSERWRADFTAREVIQEVEDLIINFSPLTCNDEAVKKDDIVPEPRVNQYDYSNGGILIPSPFGDLSFEELDSINEGLLKYPNNKTRRGILTAIKVSNQDQVMDKGYENWFNGSTIYNTKIYKVSTPPPLNTTNILDWLKENNIQFKPKKNQFIIFAFQDEWGKKDNMRVAWVALKILQSNASWIRCYLVSDDDIDIRTPHGVKLQKKTVLVVGAGSLGSIVSTTLAQEGVGNINLIDYDIYEPSNSIRHQVGQNLFALPKVHGVMDRILELSPKTNVIPYALAVGSDRGRVDSHFQFLEALKSADIVIDTTGEHSVTHFLNRLCVKLKIPFVIGSVTNGAWSCEVVRYVPNHSGCWGCWNRTYRHKNPPSSPVGEMQFAPGCDQPTFIGGISSINIAGGLVSKAVIDTLLDVDFDQGHYIVWSERDNSGTRSYSVEYLNNPSLKDCVVCNED